MTLSLREQGNRLIARRWKYCKESKRGKPTTVFSTSLHSLPETLPEDVINEFDVTQEELASYEKYVSDKNEASKLESQKLKLSISDVNIKRLIEALENPEACEDMTIEKYEEISELLATAKKAATRNKQALKRKAKKEAS